MTLNSQSRLADSKFLQEFSDMRRQVREIRSKQTSGSDVLSPTVGTATTAGTTNLTAAFQDIGVSLTIVPDVASSLIVIAIWAFDANGGAVAGDVAEGRLLLDGSPETDIASFTLDANDAEATVGNTYELSLTAASHIVKLQARNDTAVRGQATADSAFSYWLFKT